MCFAKMFELLIFWQIKPVAPPPTIPNAARLRRQTVEHPFGTLKFRMEAAHFLTMTLQNVRTEMRLNVLAYNMKRAIKLLGA
jgi:hypothetical protein